MGPKQYFEADCNWAETVLRDRGLLQPMFVLHCDIGIVPVLAVFRNSSEKAMMYEFVRTLCTAYNAVSLSMMMEAWGADGMGDGTPPSQRKDRYELLVVTMAARGENGIERHGSCRKILRDQNDKVTGLGGEVNSSGEMDGTAYHLLSEIQATPEARADALAKLKQAGVEPEKMSIKRTVH